MLFGIFLIHLQSAYNPSHSLTVPHHNELANAKVILSGECLRSASWIVKGWDHLADRLSLMGLIVFMLLTEIPILKRTTVSLSIKNKVYNKSGITKLEPDTETENSDFISDISKRDLRFWFEMRWKTVKPQNPHRVTINLFSETSLCSLSRKQSVLCYIQQIWTSTLATAGMKTERNSITLDWNVFLCILEQRRKRIRSFVSQLLDFGSVGMEIPKWWREGKHWTILVNVENMTQGKRKWHIKHTLYWEVHFFTVTVN